MRIYLIRHGESLANAGLTDQIDCPLSERGKEQTAEAAKALRGVDVTCILSSPYHRCLQAAEILGRITGAPVEFFPAVQAHYHEPFPPGCPPLPELDRLAERWPDFTVRPEMQPGRWAAVPENRTELWRRIDRAVRYVLGRFSRTPRAHVVIMTHRAPVSVFVQAFCQWPNPLNVRVHADLGSISILEVDPAGRRHVVRLNWVPGSAELDADPAPPPGP